MATVRLSPGIYSVNGRTVKANNAAQAEQMAGVKPAAKKGGGASPRRVATPGNALNAKQQGRVSADLAAGRQFAAQNNLTQNANVATPFSKTTSTVDPTTGQLTQDTSLSGTEQGKYDAGSALNVGGINKANEQLSSIGKFAPGDYGAQRDKAFNSAYGYLTRNLDSQQQREKAQTEQDLYNRGIPLNANDPQYQAHIGEMNKRYDQARTDAANQAYNASLAEQQTGFNQGLQTQQQNISDLGSLSNLGTGLMVPNAPTPQGSTTENPGVTATDIAYRNLANQTKQTNTAAKLANRRYSGSTGTTEESAFLS